MPPLQSVRILDQLRERIWYLHCSLRTEEAYVYRTLTLIRFHDLRQPAEMGKAEIRPLRSQHQLISKLINTDTHVPRHRFQRTPTLGFKLLFTETALPLTFYIRYKLQHWRAFTGIFLWNGRPNGDLHNN